MREFWHTVRRLDWRELGRAPLAARATLIGLAFASVFAAGVWHRIAFGIAAERTAAMDAERQLRSRFEQRQRDVALAAEYAGQLQAGEDSWTQWAVRLPGASQVPAMLAQIVEAGRRAGLAERSFQPGVERHHQFYAELPIRVRFAGTYAQIARFAGDLAALPRLVTLDDVQIEAESPAGERESLVLDATIRVYRSLQAESP